MHTELQSSGQSQGDVVLEATGTVISRLEEIRDRIELAVYAAKVRGIQAQIEADTILELELGLAPRHKRR